MTSSWVRCTRCSSLSRPESLRKSEHEIKFKLLESIDAEYYFTWREEYEDFEGHKFVIVYSNGLDHAHQIVQLANYFAQLQVLAQLGVDHVVLGEQDRAAGRRLVDVGHGLIANVQEKQFTPGVLEQKDLIFLLETERL